MCIRVVSNTGSWDPPSPRICNISKHPGHRTHSEKPSSGALEPLQPQGPSDNGWLLTAPGFNPGSITEKQGPPWFWGLPLGQALSRAASLSYSFLPAAPGVLLLQSYREVMGGAHHWNHTWSSKWTELELNPRLCSSSNPRLTSLPNFKE